MRPLIKDVYSDHKIQAIRIDTSMTYVIQAMTGDSTNTIISNLYECANTILHDALTRSRAQRINKRVKTFYNKNQHIPIFIIVSSNYVNANGPKDRPLYVDFEIRFPVKMVSFKVEDIVNIHEEIIEKSIGLRSSVTRRVNFKVPEISIPKHLKGIV